jgi:hypothetical protein
MNSSETTQAKAKSTAPKAKVNQGKTPSNYICTHSSTASGLYALEVLDRLHAQGRITMDDVRQLVADYDEEG